MQIVPAILSGSQVEVRNMLEQIKDKKIYEKVQVDFIDGEYAKNTTIKPMDMDLTAFIVMDFEAHLMVVEKNLADYTRWAEKTGYDEIIVQMESAAAPEKYTALALDIHSPVVAVEPYIKNLKMITLMAVEPGFGGQEFDNKVIEKAKYLNDLRSRQNLNFKIQIDGGIQKEHLELLKKLGVDEAVVGAERALKF